MSAPHVTVVAIAGGTASGKTSIARKLRESVGEERSALLELDSYYRDISHLTLAQRQDFNFDHPNAFDFDLLAAHIRELGAGRAIDMPVYDYVHHNRHAEPRRIQPRPLVLVEGILVLWHPLVRELIDIKVFVETPDDLRLMRRIQRDTVERGRTLESVLRQYEQTVRPCHLEFCEPTKTLADVIIPRGGENVIAVDLVRSLLMSRFAG